VTVSSTRSNSSVSVASSSSTSSSSGRNEFDDVNWMTRSGGNSTNEIEPDIQGGPPVTSTVQGVDKMNLPKDNDMAQAVGHQGRPKK